MTLCALVTGPTAAVSSARTFATLIGFTARNYLDNLKVIINGVPEKGMLTWRSLLAERNQAVASYIYTLRGTEPPNPKPPENQQQPEKPSIYE
jgi:hypothetical protein